MILFGSYKNLFGDEVVSATIKFNAVKVVTKELIETAEFDYRAEICRELTRELETQISIWLKEQRDGRRS